MARVTTMLRTTGWRKIAAISAAVLLVLLTTAAVAHIHSDHATDEAHCSLCLSAHHTAATPATVFIATTALAVRRLELPQRSAPRASADHRLPYSSRPPPALLAV